VQSTRDKEYKNIRPWILVRNSEDGVHGPEMAEDNIVPFVTGFENATPKYLQEFIASNIDYENKYLDFKGTIEKRMFIILDAQSSVDGTCLLYFYWSEDVSPDEDANDNVSTEWTEEWKVYRVKFLMAWHLASSLWHRADLVFRGFKDMKKNYVDANGILQFPGIEHEHEFDPPLETMVPYGPIPGTTQAK